jgi:hypothetical protein
MGYKTYILHLAPSTLSGYQVCPMASAGCKAACLNTSGRGRFPRIQEARIRKTKWFFENRDTFMTELVKDVEAGIRKADREGFIPVFRLNGTSDIRWENIPVVIASNSIPWGDTTYPNIMEAFPEYQFYDYTKISNRSNIPDNYHLTFSLSESNLETSKKMAREGYNVAVVFEKELPKKYLSKNVVDGTETDLRFLDPANVVVGLVAKGKAKKDKTNFVVRV